MLYDFYGPSDSAVSPVASFGQASERFAAAVAKAVAEASLLDPECKADFGSADARFAVAVASCASATLAADQVPAAKDTEHTTEPSNDDDENNENLLDDELATLFRKASQRERDEPGGWYQNCRGGTFGTLTRKGLHKVPCPCCGVFMAALQNLPTKDLFVCDDCGCHLQGGRQGNSAMFCTGCDFAFCSPCGLIRHEASSAS